ncbi:MAG: 50S ribosomal protein L20 [Lentisphaerae bacterium]|nr:MAG: 50S ribosomal protein L20 [Lentisphaerota bacterium]
MRNTAVPASKKRRKRILARAKGFQDGRRKLRAAIDAVNKAEAFAYVGRKQKKRQYRRLWNVRINAACRSRDINYSRFIHGLKLAGIELNRKMLADLAVTDEAAFDQLVEQAKQSIAAQG